MIAWEFVALVTQHLWPGLLAAATFLLGIVIIAILPKYKWLAAAVLLVIVTPIAIPGFWISSARLGISDWDQYFSHYHYLHRSITEFRQFPLWNPWMCGGTAAWGDPEFTGFSPTFLAILALGVESGLRLIIYIATAVGALGMLALGKRLGFSVYTALLAAIGVAFSSVNLLEIVEGHPNIFSAMYVPWIFWSWLAAYKTNKKGWVIACGIVLALTFLQGGIYLLSYTTLAFLVLILLAPNHKRAFLVTLKSGLWALGFAGIKLIPTLFWLSQFPDKTYAGSTYTLLYIHRILFGRYLHGHGDPQGIIPNQGSGWHEYGAYIGPFIGALALIGLTKLRKTRVVPALAIATVLAILLSSAGPVLKPVFDQIPFIPRSNISRIILFAVIPLALLAGYGLDALRERMTRRWLVVFISIAILGYVASDLFTLSAQLSQQAFVIPYPEIPIPAAPVPVAHIAHTYELRHNGVDYTRAYAASLQGYGTNAHCTVLGPTQAVRTIHDQENFGPVLQTNQTAVLQTEWSPSKVVTSVRTISVPTVPLAEVMLNTNYAKGWWVTIEGDNDPKPAQNIQGRVGIQVPPGEHTLTFYYRPRGMVTGLVVSSLTILGAIIWGVGTRRRARSIPAHLSPSPPAPDPGSQIVP